MFIKDRVHLNKSQTLFHYFFVLILILTSLVFLFLYFNETNNALKSYFLRYSTIVMFLAVLLGIYQYSKLEYKSIKVKISLIDFEEIILKLARENNWIPEYKNGNKQILTTLFKWYNWGTLIHVEHHKDSVKINSICDLYKRPSTSSFGKNRKNVQAFLNEFEKYS